MCATILENSNIVNRYLFLFKKFAANMCGIGDFQGQDGMPESVGLSNTGNKKAGYPKVPGFYVT